MQRKPKLNYFIKLLLVLIYYFDTFCITYTISSLRGSVNSIQTACIVSFIIAAIQAFNLIVLNEY